MGLSDGTVSIVLAIIAMLGVVFVPIINGHFARKKDQNETEQEREQKYVEESSEVRIAEINSEVATRQELWSEVRALRKDYNQLSLAYAELQRSNAESQGEVRFLRLQIQNMELEIRRMQSLLNNGHRALSEALEKLKKVEGERDKLMERITELTRDKQRIEKQLEAYHNQAPNTTGEKE